MKRRGILSVTLAVLASFVTGPVGAMPEARVPFVRFWTGHPAFGDLRGWTWNSNGDALDGQVICDGLLAGGAQGPGVFTGAPDGQLVSIWTVEDFRGAGGGPFAYQVVYDPDWQVLPSGAFTTRAQVECFDPAVMTLIQEFFPFP